MQGMLVHFGPASWAGSSAGLSWGWGSLQGHERGGEDPIKGKEIAGD